MKRSSTLALPTCHNMRVLFRESYANEKETVYVKSEGKNLELSTHFPRW